MSEKTALYRHWGSDGILLYVGVSLSAISRLQQHRFGSCWFDEIHSVTIENFDSRDEAMAAERRAIEEEAPIYNVAHSSTPAEATSLRKKKKFGSTPLSGWRRQPERDSEIVYAHQAGEAHASIARRYSISRERVRQIVSKSVESSRSDLIKEKQKEIVTAALSRGLTATEISNAMGVSRGQISSAARKYHIKIQRVPLDEVQKLRAMSEAYLAGASIFDAAGRDRAMAEKLRRFCRDAGIPLPRQRAANDNQSGSESQAA